MVSVPATKNGTASLWAQVVQELRTPLTGYLHGAAVLALRNLPLQVPVTISSVWGPCASPPAAWAVFSILPGSSHSSKAWR